MIQYKRLTKRESLACRGLTFPAYYHLLTLDDLPRHINTQEPIIKPLVVGAVKDSHIIALAIAELPIESDEAFPELLSIFVLPELRRQGIATQLLHELHHEVRQAGFVNIKTVYMSGKPSSIGFEKFILSCGWEKPETRMVSVKFTQQSLQSAPWLNKYKLNSYYQLQLWADISNEDKGKIWDSQSSNPWIPEDLVPWKHDQEDYEPLTSIGIRYKGEIVGWVINHLIDANTLRYTCSFIRKDLARLGRILPAYSESFNRIPLLQVDDIQCCYTTPLQHKEMALFAKRWFGPWSTYLGETMGSEKKLA